MSRLDGVYLPDPPSAQVAVAAAIDLCFARVDQLHRIDLRGDRMDCAIAPQLQLKLESIYER